MIGNLDAFKHFLLDWNIWKRAEFHVQTLLYKSLAQLVSINEYARFNIKQMRRIDTMRTMLMTLEEDNFPTELTKHIIDLISNVMHKCGKLSDFEVFFSQNQ